VTSAATTSVSSGRETEVSPESGTAPFGRRRGWSLRRRVREPDSYGLLVVLIIATLLAVGLSSRSAVGSVIAVVLTAGTMLFALRTSRAPTAVRRLMLGVAPTLVLATLIAQGGSSTVAGAVGWAANAVLLLGSLVAVGKRLVAHPRVDGATILGAICVYLLFGLLFASIYGLTGEFGTVFSQIPHPSAIDAVYFSFVTLATIGYGDLTPGGDLLRMIAVLEGLSGQLYLVTVIAVLVSNVGATRRAPTGAARSGGPAGDA